MVSMLASMPWLQFNPLSLMNANKGVFGVNLGHMWDQVDRMKRDGSDSENGDAKLLSVSAGYDPRAPLSLDEDGGRFERLLEKDLKGTRIARGGDFNGHIPCKPEVLNVSTSV
jgi:hypothetical protein